MSKQKIREWLMDNHGIDQNTEGNRWLVDIIHQYTKDQSAWNEERTALLQAVRFYAEQADYSTSWNVDSAFHVMEDKGNVAKNALSKQNEVTGHSAWVSELDELLMMFIADGYSASGKVSKKTAIKMMRFVGSRPKLQVMVNNSDKNGILSYKPSLPPTQNHQPYPTQ